MELEDLKRDSARLTWLIEEALEGRHHLARAGVDQHSVRAYVDHHEAYMQRHVPDADRNTAIHKARAVVK
jgi:hypothetical protein